VAKAALRAAGEGHLPPGPAPSETAGALVVGGSDSGGEVVGDVVGVVGGVAVVGGLAVEPPQAATTIAESSAGSESRSNRQGLTSSDPRAA
jgi:hypothetical protein